MIDTLTRRSFLAGAAAAAATLTAACAGSSSDGSARINRAYDPAYFTADEWAFIVAAVDRLIPASEEGPGGIQSGVAEFIDRQMESPYGYGAFAYMSGPFLTDLPPSLGYQLRYTPREMYRSGIAAADAAAHRSYSARFSDLAIDRQDEFLRSLETGAITLEGPPAEAFFEQLLRNTKEGYFADPMYGGNRHMGAWKMIGFPGARADFTDWMDQQGRHYPYGPVSVNGSKDR